MPFINIALSGTYLSGAQKQNLFNETTRLMSEVMKKNPHLTSVRIDEYPPESWAVAGKTMSHRNEVAVHMDIKITQGTNTDEEKAEMIRQGMAMLKKIVGNTTEASYIVIHDLNGSAWGYDGRTQISRAKRNIAA